MFKPGDTVNAVYPNGSQYDNLTVQAVATTSNNKLYYRVTNNRASQGTWLSQDYVFKQLSDQDINAFQHDVPLPKDKQ